MFYSSIFIYGVQLPESILEPLLFATIVFNIAGLFGGFLGFCKFALPIICSAIAASAYGNFHFCLF